MKGLTVLEILILVMLTAFAIVYVGSSFLQPKQVVNTNKPVIIIYSAHVIGNLSNPNTAPAGFCRNASIALYNEGILSSDKPITFGNATTSKYAYTLIIYVVTPGIVNGIMLASPEGGTLYKVYNVRLSLDVGRYLVCIYSDKYIKNTKITFVGAVNNCINCVVS